VRSSTSNAEALRWCKLAANQVHATSQFNIGRSCEHGLGVVCGEEEAVRWNRLARLAVVQEHASAQGNLKFFYANGTRVVQNFAEVLQWYQVAAVHGDAPAQVNAGVCYEIGTGVV
jgi:TPR repeat protein